MSKQTLTVEQMRLAGEASIKDFWSDEELDLIIAGAKLAYSYLKGKGSDWGLAYNPLAIEIDFLERTRIQRQRNK